jgi:hypothetical protein
MFQRYIVVVAALVVLVLTLFAAAFPDPAARLFVEDGPIEMVGALVFLVAGVLATLGAVRPGRHRGWFAFAGLAGLTAFLSEISFGERLLGFEAPIRYGVKLDAVHDLLQLARRIADSYVASPLFVPAILALLLALGVWVALRLHRRGPPRGAGLLAGAVAAVAAAIILDLKLAILRPLPFKHLHLEESIEFAAAMLLLGFAIQSGRPSVRPVERGADLRRTDA